MANDVTTPGKSAVPDFLKGNQKQQVGNIDNSDLIIPRIKLLQAISPEVAESNLPGAAPGAWWHTTAAEPVGKPNEPIRGVPIIVRKSIVLWAPRSDDRGVLARSSDGVNWDDGYENLEFEVKLKGMPKPVKYFTGPNVKASGLADFGSSVPGDPNSAPAASLTYNMLWYFPDFPELSPAVIINTRSAVKPAKMLLSNLQQNPVDHFGRVFLIKVVDMVGQEGPYKGYGYQSDGYVDEETYAVTKKLYEQFKDANWKADDEAEESDAPSGGGAGGDTTTTAF